MAIPLHLLGPFWFDGCWGTPGLPQSQIAGESRPAVEGHALYELAQRGEPFTFRTIKGCTTYAAACELWELYPIAGGLPFPCTLTIADRTVNQVRYQVLRVEGEVKAAVKFCRPNDATNYQAFVHATWSLLPLADPDA